MKFQNVVVVTQEDDEFTVGPFETLDDATCYVEEMIEKIKKFNSEAKYVRTNAFRWEARHKAFRPGAPTALEVLVLEQPEDLAAWYAPKK